MLVFIHSESSNIIPIRDVGNIQKYGGTCIQGAPPHLKKGNYVTSKVALYIQIIESGGHVPSVPPAPTSIIPITSYIILSLIHYIIL